MSRTWSPHSLSFTVLVMGVSLAVIRTAADFVPPAVMLPPGSWVLGYTVFGAVVGALLHTLIPGRVSLRQMLVVGALAFGSTFQLLVFSWGWLFDGYALWPLGWPWSGLLLFAVLGGSSAWVLAHYSRLPIHPLVLEVGAFVAFGSGELVDLAVRNQVVPRLHLPEMSLPITIMIHGVANFCCGVIIGLGLWVCTRRPTTRTPRFSPRESDRHTSRVVG